MDGAPVIISRREAIAKGLKRYFTGTACKHGHISERYIVGKCIACGSVKRTSEKAVAWVQEYRKKNKEKASDYNKNYYFANKEKIKVVTCKYYLKNQEKIKDRARNYKINNKDTVFITNRLYREINIEKIKVDKQEYRINNKTNVAKWSKKYQSANKERIAATKSIYMQNNGSLFTSLRAKRRAAKRCATPLWANLDKINEIYLQAKTQGKHVDHVIPLRGKMVSGLHVEANLQLLDPILNLVKGNKFNPVDHEFGLHVTPAGSHHACAAVVAAPSPCSVW